MTADIVYSILIRCSWFFLGGWTLVLLLASVAAFREELSEALAD
ncbi:MAG: hypothetical protein ACHP8A_05890 [Terriglobales bacterium]|jgi:hypothetical protein